MNKKNLFTCTFYFAVTLALAITNIFYTDQTSKLDSELTRAIKKCEERTALLEKVSGAKSELFKLRSNARRYDRAIIDLVNSKETMEMDPHRLLNDQYSTIIVPEKGLRQKIRILTSETGRYELLYEISHQFFEPRTETLPNKDGKELDKISYVVPVTPNKWNVIGFIMDRGNQGEPLFTKQVDREITLFGEIPEFPAESTPSAEFDIFFGNLSPDAKGVCFQSNPFKRVLLRTTDPNSIEAVVISLTLRKIK